MALHPPMDTTYNKTFIEDSNTKKPASEQEYNSNNQSRKSFFVDSESPPTAPINPPRNFLPFMKERDGLGRLIHATNSKKDKPLHPKFNWLGNELRKFVHTPKHSMSLTRLLETESPDSLPRLMMNKIMGKMINQNDKLAKESRNSSPKLFANTIVDFEDKNLTFTSFKINSKVLERSAKCQNNSISPCPNNSMIYGSGNGAGYGCNSSLIESIPEYDGRDSKLQNKIRAKSLKMMKIAAKKKSASFLSPEREDYDKKFLKKSEKVPFIGYYDSSNLALIKPRNITFIIRNHKMDFNQTAKRQSLAKTSSEPLLLRKTFNHSANESLVIDNPPQRVDRFLKGPDFSKQLARQDIPKRSARTKDKDKFVKDLYINDFNERDGIFSFTSYIQTQSHTNQYPRSISKSFTRNLNSNTLPLGLQGINDLRHSIM